MMAASNEKADPPRPATVAQLSAGQARRASQRARRAGHVNPPGPAVLRVGAALVRRAIETVREVWHQGLRHPGGRPLRVHVLGDVGARPAGSGAGARGSAGSLGTADVVHTLPRLVVLRHEDTRIALVADDQGHHRAPGGGRCLRRARRRSPPLPGGRVSSGREAGCMIDVPALIAEPRRGGHAPREPRPGHAVLGCSPAACPLCWPPMRWPSSAPTVPTPPRWPPAGPARGDDGW